MEFITKKIKVSDIFSGYVNLKEKGVVAYGGKLNVRPAYQREFIYNDKEEKAVINSILHGYPLNTFYWAANTDGDCELMDGQQRTMSVLEFLSGNFGITYNDDEIKASGLKKSYPELYAKIMDYEFHVEVCTGTAMEKLEWFRILNTPQKQMTAQELRNAAYTGPWLSDAKSRLSSTGTKDWDDYVSGKAVRQEILEYALSCICEKNDCTIEQYMAEHQFDANSDELCDYFTRIISWVKDLFVKNNGTYRKEMKSVDWGKLYNECHNNDYPTTELRNKCDTLMADDEVTSKKGIYPYLLTGEERYLNLRAFSDTMKRAAYERQEGVCPVCKHHCELTEMQGDHISPWSKGGKTDLDNLQMLCSVCNNKKSNH